MHRLVERAHALAEDLFAGSTAVDRDGKVPEEHWRRLADEGFYGAAAPVDAGGPGLELPEVMEVLELLAGGCLATTFTWMQHHGVVLGLAGSPNIALRDELLADAVAGRVRGGVAFAGVVPDPPRVTATRTDGGWLLTGDAPFVSGWGVVHVLQLSAGEIETGDVLAGIVPAGEQAGITSVTPQSLVAADATATVRLRLDELFLPDDRVVSRVPRADFLAGLLFGGRVNGSVALGVARRSVVELDRSGAGAGAAADALRTALDAARDRLDAALGDPDDLPAARARAAELAVRAANALVVARGGAGLLRDDPAQLLARNAMFALVAATRPQIKQELLGRLAHAGG